MVSTPQNALARVPQIRIQIVWSSRTRPHRNLSQHQRRHLPL